MTQQMPFNNRRREIRENSDDVIRWKRPGRIEDHRGWTLDASPSGIGFMTEAHVAPRIGETIHLRKLDKDRWATIEQPVRVRRISATSSRNIVIVGCALGH